MDSGERYPVLYKLLYIKECIPVTNRFHMIFQRFLINGDTFQNKRGFPQSQGVAFNRIGVIGVFHHKLVTQTLKLSRSQRATMIQLLFQTINSGKQGSILTWDILYAASCAYRQASQHPQESGKTAHLSQHRESPPAHKVPEHDGRKFPIVPQLALH